MADSNDTLIPAPKHPELPSGSLRWYADPGIFDFPTTAHIDPFDGIIGQRRAIEALTLGAEIYSPGYNIFVSGLAGTGRMSTIKSIVERMRPNFNVPHDYAYVNNFRNPDSPRLLVFPRGKAASFEKALGAAITYLRLHLSRMFDDEKFRAGRTRIVEEFQSREREMLDAFDATLRPHGFTLGQRKNGEAIQPEILPVINEKPVPIESLGQVVAAGTITEEQAKELVATYEKLSTGLYDLARQGMQLSQEFQHSIADYEHGAAQVITLPAIDDLRSRFPFDEVRSYLDDVRDDILENLEKFRQAGEEEVDEDPAKQELFKVYRVNVVLDNANTSGSPAIIETTPTFVNLFGTIERVYDQRTGFWSTDFTQIKGGSLLKADGGYLIINATDALSEAGVWKALKRILLNRKLEIQPIESFFQTSSAATSTLKPEPIKLNVKVIMIGDSRLYQALFDGEEDFRKIFKINAQFDYEINRTDEILIDYARFVRRICDEENLLQFERESVAAVVEYAVERAGNVRKISLRFSDIADLLRESSFWAEAEGAEIVSRYHVEKAYVMMADRNSLWKEKTLEQITSGVMMIDTAGRRVGQINGLAVYSSGQTSFGKPSRITATVSVGTQGIINIDREAQLGGSIYNKGTMILNGFFRNRFAQTRPLALSASIVFEQSYGGVEGDSASSTEVYALLSALSRVPIRQDLAVTGSVNQWGEIQPIGGVKEKIEGFFDVCRIRGLTGTQGVLIPTQNVSDLMLSNEVVEAVGEGRFHVYSVSSIDQGIEILTGIAAGMPNEHGEYPEGTINALVEARLAELAESLRRSMPMPFTEGPRAALLHVQEPDVNGNSDDVDEPHPEDFA
ncbi:MAG TPA: ATP-binding protein [Candidatus Kapabacteria bacterium]|nr:ATP-binding protein [Candidatus Kapabacteria bacterium]